jgi:hypothetical protein
MFPRFSEGDLTITDPLEFASPPTVRYFYPNYLLIAFSPLSGIDCVAEYWVPASQVVAGRLSFTNPGNVTRYIQVDWVALLNPADEGQRIAPAEMAAATVLTGQSGDLAPVVFLTGGPQPAAGPYPALALAFDLASVQTRQFTWTSAALSSAADSFELARHTAARNLDAESARIQLMNGGLAEVYTGNPDWDAAFAFSQKAALNLFVGPTDKLPNLSFVITRQPDHGYSRRGDGGDYNHLWNGQTPLDTCYLASLLLPAQPELAKALICNFLSTAQDNGFVDWKPGLGGQRSQLLATPLLASLVDMIYQATGDRSWLEEAFPILLGYIKAWLTPPHDRDTDGIPEWDHPMQSGFDDHPLFAHWHSWSIGADIESAESPLLCALLYRESKTLIRFANILKQNTPIPQLQALAESLRQAIEISWDPQVALYRYWDRDSHYCTPYELIGERLGSGDILIERDFEYPIRLLIRVQTRGETTRRPHVFIHGTNISGQHLVERMLNDRFHWHIGKATSTSERVYTQLERVLIQGLDKNDSVALYSVGYTCQDQTLLIPLWASIPAPDRARDIIENCITSPDRFWRPFGIPACIQTTVLEETDICDLIHLPWNHLIGEGMLTYGYRREAAALVSRLMDVIIRTLKNEGAFRHHYHSTTGVGYGERNSVQGLAPLGLFLDVLGVHLLSPKQVALEGINPFPWPVTVKYRGLTVLRQQEKTTVIFPDGQTIMVEGPEPCTVSLD